MAATNLQMALQQQQAALQMAQAGILPPATPGLNPQAQAAAMAHTAALMAGMNQDPNMVQAAAGALPGFSMMPGMMPDATAGWCTQDGLCQVTLWAHVLFGNPEPCSAASHSAESCAWVRVCCQRHAATSLFVQPAARELFTPSLIPACCGLSPAGVGGMNQMQMIMYYAQLGMMSQMNNAGGNLGMGMPPPAPGALPNMPNMMFPMMTPQQMAAFCATTQQQWPAGMPAVPGMPASAIANIAAAAAVAATAATNQDVSC